MSIKAWPSAERPRERLLTRGAEHLSDGELLALLLGSGRPGMDALALARTLLARTDGLARLVDGPNAEILEIPGLGPTALARIRGGVELGRRYVQSPIRRGAPLTDPARAVGYLQAQLAGQRRETFCCLFLDTRHRQIRCEELFRGTLDGASVYPREVVRRALELDAAALILSHNHPSGVAEPSRADRLITERLNRALSLVDIRILDHLVIARGGEAVSMAQRGWL